jgi:Superfamily II DNA and RNA helicases
VQILDQHALKPITSDSRPPRRRSRRRNPAAQADAPVSSSPERAASIQIPDRSTVPEDFHFGDLDLDENVLRAVYELGYREPTPIQSAVIPLLLEDRDIVGQATNGDGQDSRIWHTHSPACEPRSKLTQVVILVPTRELAMQVGRDLEAIGRYSGFSVAVLYGGAPIAKQLRVLEEGAQVVVGTPGRVMDHMQRQTLDLSQVRLAILDEADEMLDIGFADDMEWILRHTPRSRQTALFSATVPGFIRRLIYRYLREPEHVHVNPEDATVNEIEQVYF